MVLLALFYQGWRPLINRSLR